MKYLLLENFKQAVFFMENKLPLQPENSESFFSSNKGEIHAHR